MKKAKNKKLCCVCSLVVITLVMIVVTVVVIIVTRPSNDSEDTAQLQSEVSYQLHVNPADPVIMSAETPEGDLISMLGNKSANGEPQAIDEFLIENEDGSTFVLMNDDGTIESAEGGDGFNIDFVWDENQTTVYTSVVLNNGSQQLSIRVNLSEPVGENFTSFMSDDIDMDIPSKRSLPNGYRQRSSTGHKTTSKTTVKRQSNTQTTAHASVFVSVESCSTLESDARVFADVLLDYDQGSGTYEGKAKYWGTKSSNAGEYEVQIPISKASVVGDKIGNICDKINMILGKICSFYSKANKVTQIVSGHNVDSVFCFLLGKGLRLAFPALRLLPIYRFCITIFKPLKAYCDKADADLPVIGESPVDLLCKGLPLVDNGIDLLNEKDIFFTPTAIIPPGNHVQGTGQVLSIQPGITIVPQRFTIIDDERLRITAFGVVPVGPLPGKDYVVTVSYNCYSSSTFFVNMSIVGTDGYIDSNICYTGPSCVLYVPGAAALVRDDVEIYIQSGQTTISRMVVVII